MDGYPKRYNDLVEAYVPAQYAGIVRDPKGGGVGTQGPIINVSSLRLGSQAISYRSTRRIIKKQNIYISH